MAPANTNCSIPDCERPHKARGWCNSHYERWRRHGTTDLQPRPPMPSVQEKFWRNIDVDEFVLTARVTCWPWHGAIEGHGYGVIFHAPEKYMAHRVAYEMAIGPIPDGKQIDHLCRNHACVNPYHLEAVTIKENVLRGVGISAHNARKTHCVNGHPFDEENTYRPPARQHTRGCKKCRLKNQRISYHRRKWRVQDPADEGFHVEVKVL